MKTFVAGSVPVGCSTSAHGIRKTHGCDACCACSTVESPVHLSQEKQSIGVIIPSLEVG